MKITKRQLKALIESVLLEQEQKKKSGIFSRIKSFFRNRKLDKSIFKDIDKEDFPSVYFDRFDDYTKEIARKNYDDLRAKGELEKTGLFKDLYAGSVGMESEALLISYLLVGHKDFEGMSQPEIRKKLIELFAPTNVQGESESGKSLMSDYTKAIRDGDRFKGVSERVKEYALAMESEVNLTGQVAKKENRELEYDIGGQSVVLSLAVHQTDNVQAYKYGMIPEKGKGKSVFTGDLLLTINGKEYNITHSKGNSNTAYSEDKKKQILELDGLFIDGQKCAGYQADGKPSFAKPQVYQNFIGSILRKLPKNFDDESKNEILGIIHQCLVSIGYDPSIFKPKLQGRKEVLIGSDGSSVVGSEAISAYLKQRGHSVPILAPSKLNENKHLNFESLSRGSLYRKKYYGRY
tara:strand:- start:1693 stop:2910 length:1218 start_codon:yes stop_codon:yes gene_type:complete